MSIFPLDFLPEIVNLKDINISKESLKLHKKLKGKITVNSKVKVRNRKDLSLIYTPGVGAVSTYLADNKDQTRDYTIKNNSVAVISDGSAVLGLGNIGPEGALPVMEGKCQLFNAFAGIDAFPIVLSTQDPEEIIQTVIAIAPTFGGINLEDFAAPKCFYIEERLKKELDIPVIHDDQWGTAVVVLAGLINALKLAKKDFSTSNFVISGAGAAGTAIIKIIKKIGAKNILVIDRTGIIYKNRTENSIEKEKIAKLTNPKNKQGQLKDAMENADVFIGVSTAGILNQDMVKSMSKNPIIFALANPIPEIMPNLAKKAGAFIVATGRSDFPNQVNNALSFPGIFRGALDSRVNQITIEMLINAAQALAKLVKKPTPEKIIPSIFDKGVMKAVANSIKT